MLIKIAIATPNFNAMLATSRIGSSRCSPQLRDEKISAPSATPKTSICSRNWIWLSSATPASAVSV